MKVNKPKASIYAYFSSTVFNADSESLMESEMRFNAEYYEPNTSLLISKNINFEPLSSFASVVFPGIFKRYLVDDVKYGIKFLTTSDMMMLEPETDKILSTQLTSNLPIYRVSDDTLLVSRSGTIGNTIYVDKRLSNFAITEDALRVRPFDKVNMGLLYFYFISEHGKNTISGKKSGAVIDHIYEDDLLKLPIPILPLVLIQKLFETYIQVKKYREEASEIIESARKLVYLYNKLPEFTEKKESDHPEFPSEYRYASISEFTHDYRLDAHFYSNIYREARQTIIDNSPSYDVLSHFSTRIFMGYRFIRNLVDKGNGVPFIGTKNTLQIRPTEYKFLSSTETENLADLLLEKEWILLARSGSLGGTFGKVSFVWKNFEGYAGSDHIIRICCNKKKIDPGYLYAFLNCTYGYHGITQIRHGSLIDEIDPEDLGQILIPIPTKEQQKEIGDMIRQAYDFRAQAIRLEDEAQALLTQALTN